MYDLLILNGKIVTGTGNPWFYGDVGIIKNKIVKIGRLSTEEANQVINAQDCVVSPGFIDAHSHADLFIFAEPLAEQKVRQGVTTENVGMDGMSVAPIDEGNVSLWSKHLAGLAGALSVDWGWRSFEDYLYALDAIRPSINISSYVGLGTIRLKVIGLADRPATPEEVEQMKGLAAKAMEEGARGISAGLIYPPSQYQTIDEVVEIARVVQKYNGIYSVHMRSEGDRLIEAMEEVIEISRRSGIPVSITHFKVFGKKNWGLSERSLKLVDDTRRQGIDLTIEQYPYIAGSTMLHAIIPPWFHSRGPDELIRTLYEDRATIKRDICGRTDWENFVASVGWNNVMVSSVQSDENKEFEGKNMVEIATMKSLDDPADAALDLLAEEKLAVGMIVFFGDERDVIPIMQHPAMSVITDGLPAGGNPHPRVYGAFPRILGRYVREQRVLSLEEAIRKMTYSTAEKLRLRSKGLIAEKFDADITIFNPETIIDNATFDKPRQFSTGIEWVIVNGEVVVEKGTHTGARPGCTVRTR